MRVGARNRAPADSARPQQFTTYALWIAQILLSLLFLFAGSMKFVMSADQMTKDIDLPIWFLQFIGACEILGAIALIGPGLLRFRRGLTPVAASGLVVIMIGATVITAATMGMLAAAWPLAVGIVAASIAYGRWNWFNEA
ncbi:MAG: DoxX family protein [Chloroflexi bacterium]|nr:DoxX family protein [Chloroflexota bacterium]